MKFLVIILSLFITACQFQPAFEDSAQGETSSPIKNKIDYNRLPMTARIKGMYSCSIEQSKLQTLLDVHSGKLVPNSQLSRSVGNIPMTIPEMNEWINVKNTIESFSPPVVINPYEDRDVYFVIFDGTWNDRDDEGQITVPGKLANNLEILANKNPNVTVQYYSGVGTRVPLANKIADGITGNGAKTKAEQAFQDLEQFIKSNDHNPPHVYTIGFSRGAATARHFLNLVNDLYKNAKPIENTLFKYPRLYALLFDTVATGQYEELRLEIPEETTSVLHLVASSEERQLFPVVRINIPTDEILLAPRFVEVDLPGVHSDIGGGYGDTLEGISYFFALTWLENQGLKLEVSRPNFQAALNYGKNDSRYIKLKAVKEQNHRKEIILPLNKHSNTKQVTPESIAEYLKQSEISINRTLVFSSLTLLSEKGKSKRAKQKKEDIIQRLSLNLSLNDEELIIQTNCPQYVTYNNHSGFIELLGEQFAPLTPELINDLQNSKGQITAYPILSRDNYTLANPS